MDPHRLALLLDLSRLGSMREVAEVHRTSTSTVSQQIAALARQAGTALVEPDGRRVRLTPAGRRLADHAVTILAAVDAARLDLDPDAEPSGTVRVGGFATAVRRAVLPVVAALATSHPAVHLQLAETEPLETLALLADDDLDVGLTYDYNLAPATLPATMVAVPLWRTEWGLGMPGDRTPRAAVGLRELAGTPWVVNSRNTADEVAIGVLAGLAGFTPTITHRIDSLDLVEDLIRAGHGVGLLPRDRPTGPGVVVRRLPEPRVVLTAYAVTRRGRESWPPLRLVLDRLTEAT
ncbi:LysR family transcriptional regulator [Nocardioides rotundus]|uniref:LysR family transcriptional regulator n=1 Tax=Nocardioides rotundus TaxID=1774216 RepID=UPI001CBF6EAC|nr:LysR family transcriptional regulator [Nocardioides rotundus]UAL31269.1 LysR family transcriptional regulator [Nocardioides rotundus]